MRFLLHGSASLIGIQIDWGTPIDDLSPALQAAMPGHDVAQMQHGRVRRGYLAKGLLYPRGAIALRIAEGHEIFLEGPPATSIAPGEFASAPTVATCAASAGLDHHRVIVGDDLDGERIDVIVTGAVATLSRAVIQRLIADGHVTAAGLPVKKANRRCRRGEVIELRVPRPAAA